MRNKRGITLIALIITIIVLLILAGVSISIVVGDNGVLNQAQNAKAKTDFASAKEALETVIASFQAEYATIITENANADIADVYTMKSFNDELNKLGYNLCYGTLTSEESIFGNNSIVGTSFVNSIKLNKNSSKYKLTLTKTSNHSINVTNFEIGDSNGNEIILVDADVISSIINNDVSKVKEFYGHFVEYNNDNRWQIFYVGNEFNSNNKNYIYLIYTPLSSTLSKNAIPNVYNQESTSDVIDDANELSAWWKNYGDTAILVNDNAKTVAGMLNKNNWLSYYDSNMANWVIGGPTEDIFLKSWNQSQGLIGDNGFSYKTLGTDFVENGYIMNRIGNGVFGGKDYSILSPGDCHNSTTKNTHNGSMTRQGHFQISEEQITKLYNPGYSFWLSSPNNSRNEQVRVRYMFCSTSNLSGNVISSKGDAFRPLVCLKEGVKLTVNDDGQWCLSN